ncbi:MAG: MFS transporter [Myxococcota bacterium]
MLLERRYLPLFLVTFTLAVGYAFIYSLTAVIRSRFGISETGIGWIGGIGFAAGFVSMVSLSRYADRGHTKVMLRVGVGLVLLGNAGMIFASDLSGFLASRTLLGLGGGLFTPAVRRLVVLSDPERAGERLGAMAAFDMAGFLAGPVLATLFYELGGLRAAFAALTALVVLVAIPVLRFRFEDAPEAAGPDGRERPVRDLFARAPVRGVLLCTIAFYTTVGVFEAIWAVFLDDLGASQRYIALTLTLFAIPMLFVPIYGGRLAQRHGPLRVAAWSVGAAIPFMTLYGGLTDLTALGLLCVVHAVADSFTLPSLQLGIAQAAPRRHLASGQGLVGATGQAVAAVTAIGSGAVYQFQGAATLFVGSAAIMLVLLVAGLRQGRALMVPAAPEPV